MPSSPEIEVTVDPAAYARACAELRLEREPALHIRAGTSDTTRGEARPGRVDLYTGLSRQHHENLRHLTIQLTRTLLHELRHQHQFATWTEKQWAEDARYAYSIKPCEVDARDWADANIAKFRDLVRVRRRGVSKLGRLSAAERNSRRGL